MKKAVLALLLLLGACKTASAPEPQVVIQRVEVPVSLPCVPDKYDPKRPDYVDSDAALKAAVDAAERYQLLWAGRAQRAARESVNEAAISGCLRGSKK